MLRRKTDKPKGILNPRTHEIKTQMGRYLPSDDLSFFVEHYWTVHWDLRGQEPYFQENLAYPSFHLVVEPEKAYVVGVITGKFGYLLQDQGWVFGVKFRPGAFYPFMLSPAQPLTDTPTPLTTFFGADGDDLEAAIRQQDDDTVWVTTAEHFLRAHLPERDETVELINRIINGIMSDPTITKVDDLVERTPLSKRTLQRLFNQYVGVSPKWVIQRYRLHEATEQMATDKVTDWTQLALDLGYFDQAHFIKDFKNTIGQSPAEYAKTIEHE